MSAEARIGCELGSPVDIHPATYIYLERARTGERERVHLILIPRDCTMSKCERKMLLQRERKSMGVAFRSLVQELEECCELGYIFSKQENHVIIDWHKSFRVRFKEKNYIYFCVFTLEIKINHRSIR